MLRQNSHCLLGLVHHRVNRPMTVEARNKLSVRDNLYPLSRAAVQVAGFPPTARGLARLSCISWPGEAFSGNNFSEKDNHFHF
jgi:hypothetical protein